MKLKINKNYYVQNDFIDEIMFDPSSVTKYTTDSDDAAYDNYSILFYTALYSFHSIEKFDSVFLVSVLYNLLDEFVYDLWENNKYVTYVDSLINRDDKFMKALGIIYLEPELANYNYDSFYDIINDVVNEGNYHINSRVNALIELVKLDPSKVDIVKNTIKKLLYELKNDNSMTEEDINSKISECMNAIDKRVLKISLLQ